MKKPYGRFLSRLFSSTFLFVITSVAQATPFVDVLVLYIDAAQQTTAGRDIDARIGSYIAYSNQAFANSDVDMRLRLVGSERVELDYTYVTEANLSALRANPEVARLRQQYGADLVTLLNLRQPMSGGYVCGIGYIAPGDAASGRLYSNAPSAGFSLVGIDCGLSTFPHELGHNMSLAHSYMQNSTGGVWPWARGYGVQGLFSTIMAYPQSYGTRNQLQRFSNPDQLCMEQPCGVPQDQPQGANAVLALNRLNTQIEAFMPAVVTTDPDGDGDEPEVPHCSSDEVPNNLIVNGDFNELDGWTSAFGVSQLRVAETGTDCREQILAVTERTHAYGDAYQDLSGKLQPDREYALSAKLGIANGTRDSVRVALRLEEVGIVRYQYLATLSVTSNELTDYSANFRLDASSQPDQIGLLLYGPEPGIDILADKLVLLASAPDSPETPDEPGSGPTTVLHETFEQEAQGWASYGDSRTSFSARAFEGRYSIRNYLRRNSDSGPVRDATGIFEAGLSYTLTTQMYVRDISASSATAKLWVYYVDDEGGHWMEISNNRFATNTWQPVSGSFTIQPVGNLTQVRLLANGPRASAELYLDDLKVVRQ